MKDIDGKEIGGYRYGPYYFGVTGKGRISALSGCSYRSEVELLNDYDSVQGSHPDAPPLIRVYTDGSEVKLRPFPREAA